MKSHARIMLVLGLALAAISARAQPAVERGRYLVEGILTCGNCHSPRGPDGIIDGSRLYSGGPQTWDEPTYHVKGSNITPDAETGIGRWSEAEIKTALQEGHRPDGTQLAPVMPYPFYKVFLPADLDAVVAYLRSMPAVRSEVQRPEYKAALHVEHVPDSDKPPSEAEMRDPVKRGFYLVTIGHCMQCHSPMLQDRHDYSNWAGAVRNSEDRGASPCRATSLPTRKKALGNGPMRRLNARSRKVSARTAAR